MAAARAAPPASSRPFPQPGPPPLSPSSVTSLRGILSPAAVRAHLAPLSGAPEEEVGSLHGLDSFKAYRKVTYCPRVLPNGSRLSCGRPARRRKGVGPKAVPRQRHNTPLPLERSAPASFKRLLGGKPHPG